MIREINSKGEAIEKIKWLREKIKEWEKRFEVEGKDYIVLPKGEKREVFGTLRGLERFVNLRYLKT